MDVVLRQITRKEVAQFAFALGSGFGDPVPPEAAGRFEKFLELDRTFCCFDGDELVGTSANFSFDMTIPGNIAACAGVTMITVRPTHRRRGLLNRMMRALIDDARGRGEPLGALWASEESIYQRYGFGLASNQGHIDVERARAQFLAGAAPVGRVRLVPREEAIDELPPIYEQLRPQVPGMLSRTRGWWGEHRLADTPYHRAGGSTLFCGIWEGDEGPDGYVLYRMHPKWGDGGTSKMWLKVEELLGTTPLATRELWRFVFGVDLVERVKAWWLPADLPLTLQLEEPRRLGFAASESLWLRLVDVRAALEARAYDAEDELVIELGDDFIPENAGRWRISSTLTGAQVEPTTDAPDIALDTAALAATYLGAFTFSDLHRAVRAEELTRGALARADRMFRTHRAPWCPENF